MPVFHYSAVDQNGQVLNGVMAAEDEPNLEERLKALGCWLVDASLQKTVSQPSRRAAEGRAGKSWFTGVKRRDLIEFCTLMGFQTKSGVPVVQALDVSSQDCENVKFRKVIQGLKHHVESGLQLNEAMSKYPRVFPSQLITLIKTGEMSSKLPETFTDLRDYLEWVDRLIGDVRQACIYPLVVLSVIFLFVLMLFTYVIPKFVTLMEVAKVDLPLLTKIVFGASDFAQQTWWLWLGLFLFFTVGLKLARRFSRTFAKGVDSLKLNLPVFGELNHMIAISRFSHNVALMYHSGVPILQSMGLCQGLVGNAVVEDAVEGSCERIAAGEQISDAIRKYPVFPPLLVRMVKMGETSGNLDVALENVSEYYNDVIPRKIKKIFSIMEPALMLFLIGLVGAIALAIFLPIIELMGAIK
jgi:type II secretory pathway component PulF